MRQPQQIIAGSHAFQTIASRRTVEKNRVNFLSRPFFLSLSAGSPPQKRDESACRRSTSGAAEARIRSG